MRSTEIDRHLCKTVHGGRFVPIPGFPGEKIDRRLLPDIHWMERRYDIFITDGYSTDPVHAGNGEHPIGLATDIVPNRAEGGTWNEIAALATAAEPRQNHPIPPWRWVGWNGDPGHGRGNHLHLSWMHSPSQPRHPARVVYTRKCPTAPDEPRRLPPPQAEAGDRRHLAVRHPASGRGPSGGVSRLGCPTGWRPGWRRWFPRTRSAGVARPPNRAGPCDPPSRAVPGRSRRGWLEPGESAAHARYRLRLLPSGSDLIHGRALRGTWPSTPPATY